jgi:hypothetical protein
MKLIESGMPNMCDRHGNWIAGDDSKYPFGDPIDGLDVGTCRALIFASIVDDPSSWTDADEVGRKECRKRRKELHRIFHQLRGKNWENELPKVQSLMIATALSYMGMESLYDLKKIIHASNSDDICVLAAEDISIYFPPITIIGSEDGRMPRAASQLHLNTTALLLNTLSLFNVSSLGICLSKEYKVSIANPNYESRCINHGITNPIAIDIKWVGGEFGSAISGSSVSTWRDAARFLREEILDPHEVPSTLRMVLSSILTNLARVELAKNLNETEAEGIRRVFRRENDDAWSCAIQRYVDYCHSDAQQQLASLIVLPTINREYELWELPDLDNQIIIIVDECSLLSKVGIEDLSARPDTEDITYKDYNPMAALVFDNTCFGEDICVSDCTKISAHPESVENRSLSSKCLLEVLNTAVMEHTSPACIPNIRLIKNLYYVSLYIEHGFDKTQQLELLKPWGFNLDSTVPLQNRNQQGWLLQTARQDYDPPCQKASTNIAKLDAAGMCGQLLSEAYGVIGRHSLVNYLPHVFCDTNSALYHQYIEAGNEGFASVNLTTIKPDEKGFETQTFYKYCEIDSGGVVSIKESSGMFGKDVPPSRCECCWDRLWYIIYRLEDYSRFDEAIEGVQVWSEEELHETISAAFLLASAGFEWKERFELVLISWKELIDTAVSHVAN